MIKINAKHSVYNDQCPKKLLIFNVCAHPFRGYYFYVTHLSDRKRSV